MKKFLTYSLTILTFSWLFLAGASKISSVAAQTVLFTEDFHNGFGKWQLARSTGGLWSIINDHARAVIFTYGTLTELTPLDQYWDPSWKNTEYDFDYTPLEGVDRNITFNFQDPNNWYEIHFVDSTYNLVRVKNGVVTLNVFNSYVLKNGPTYHFQIFFEDGHIRILIDGEKVADEYDWSFNNNYGRISLKATAGTVTPTKVEFSNIVVKSIEKGINLNVPLLKQTDPVWQDEEYDQAKTWAPNKPGIKAWGCALTSMTMILNYYHVTTLPDGQALTPSTLNTWLKSQRDGYIRDGLLNWVAVTRLTRLINEKFNTTKLEMVLSAFSADLLKTELADKNPVITHLPGHFIVVDGITEDIARAKQIPGFFKSNNRRCGGSLQV